MSILVQKFGGSSVANAAKILAAAERAVRARRAGWQVVVVVSARGDKTDELIGLAHEITDDPPAREMDMLLSTGEQESVALLAMAVQKLGESAISMTGGQIGIVTDSSHTKARIRSISTARMRQALEAGNVVIAAGFQGTDEQLNITTLGRGGSDTTAVALAAVLQASVCEIYTDVEGIYTTDPRLVTAARKVARISYDEMLELASLGAGVMHSRSIEFAKKYRVPVLVRPSFSDGEGTLIAPESENHAAVVSGVALARTETRVSLLDIPDRPGVMSEIFTKMAQRKIPVDMIAQNVGAAGRAQVSFTVQQDELAETLTAAQEAVQLIGSGTVQLGTNLSKVSVVGSGMKTHTGVAAHLFRALADAGVNIGMITTSDIKISALVDRDIAEQALTVAHQSFRLDQSQPEPPSFGIPQPLEEQTAVTRSELERDIVSRLVNMEDIVVSEVQLDRQQSRVTLRNIPDVPGVVAQVFAANAEAGVMVDIIVQDVSQSGHAHVSFTVLQEDLERSLEVTRQVTSQWPAAELSCDSDIAVLSVIGIGLRTHTGVGEKMFRVLAEANINVQMISTSEVCICIVVANSRAEEAQQSLLATFGLNGVRPA